MSRFSLCLFLLAPWFLSAEQLPIKTYSAADGLAGNQINKIFRDSHGFLWFCASEGLSRFDGYKFVEYRIGPGPFQPEVRDIQETRSGVYLVSTRAGLFEFKPRGSSEVQPRERRGADFPQADVGTDGTTPSRFIGYQPNESGASSIWASLEDATGRMWVGTAGGLFQLEEKGGKWIFHLVDIGLPKETEDESIVRTLMPNRHGELWIGAESGLYLRHPDGRTERFTTRDGLPVNQVRAIQEDREGQLWIATRLGLCQMVSEPGRARPIVSRVYTEADGLPSRNITSLWQSSDGTLWVGLIGGLAEMVRAAGPGRQRFRAYAADQGLGNINIWALGEDQNGNLWMGHEGGVMKLARRGFVSYGMADGLGSSSIASIFEDQAGELCVSSLFTDIVLSRFDGRHFLAAKPRLPKHFDYYGWGWQQLSMQDRRGDWWIPTGQGLCRYSGASTLDGLAGKPPSAIYTSKNGLPFDDIFRLYEDSRGDIWIATYSEKGNGLTRREGATGILHNFTDADGLPLKTCVPSSICEDRAGNLWIGFDNGGGLARYRDGRFRIFPQVAGEPQVESPSLYVDREGRLWIATGFLGLDRMDDPTSDNPHVISLTTSEGLSSNRVLSITEDLWGRLYIGTGRGVDRLEVTTGHIKHYTSADGLVNGEVRTSFRDRQGTLWFGTTRGLSRLIPEPDSPASPPPVMIGRLHINGVAYSVSELGVSNIPDLRLRTDQNNVQIDFFALSFRLGEVLRYRYRLDGADRAWSKWAEQRSINYASLRPGNYRFQVEAENSEGNTSPLPATVSFMVLPPIWRRWWFLGLAALITGSVLAGAYNYRVSYLLEMERMRTRIATDLHDDIGSSLSQIAILSEVVRQRLGPIEAGICEPLSRIADISRELVDSMSDIVWAINPKKDLLGNLTPRMRRFASDVFTAKGIAFQFQTTLPEQEIRIGAELRRQIFLIFKEGIHNIVGHSGCTSARVGFLFDSGFVILTLDDNGKGFDSSQASLGHGLANMRSRSEQLGGQLTVSSQSDLGTTITLRVPLRSSRILR